VTRRQFVPREYQQLMVGHIMEHKRCALWAGMGLGKTVTTLLALSLLDLTEDVFPALVVGPLRVARDVWANEADKWDVLAHLHCVPIIGTAEQRMLAMSCKAPIYSINYENLPWLLKYWGEERWPYKTVIADESTKLKNYRGSYRTSSTGKVFLQNAGKGARAKALATVAHTPNVKRFIELTGTPAPNGLKDLWGQAWFLDAGERLGRTFEGFASRWFSSDRRGHVVTYTPTAAAVKGEVGDRLKDICLTIDAKDWFDLAKPIVNDIYIDLPKGVRRLYKDMEDDMFVQLACGNTIEAFGAAAKSQKCLQLANGAVYTDPTVESDANPGSKQWSEVHDLKMQALDSIVEEAAGAGMIIVYTFRSDLARILKAYPQAVDLGKKAGEKKFKAGEAQIGVAHPDSLGHGVDGLQNVCNIITHFGHGWALDTYDQINERIGPVRQMQAGLDRPVFVNHILARGTLDEEVMERRAGKRSVQEILLDAMNRRKQK